MSAVSYATILFDGRFWIGIFERRDAENYAVARHIFGSEPSDAEIYDFVLNSWEALKFTAPITDCVVHIKRKNFKRRQKEIRKLVGSLPAHRMTYAQDVLRQELEKKKKLRVSLNAQEKQEKLDQKFLLKQEKRKQKHRGH
jgi:hypothetical protein